MSDADDAHPTDAEAAADEHHEHTGTVVFTALFLMMSVGMFAWVYYLMIMRG